MIYAKLISVDTDEQGNESRFVKLKTYPHRQAFDDDREWWDVYDNGASHYLNEISYSLYFELLKASSKAMDELLYKMKQSI
jgi:hypothetical protein